MSSSGSSNGAAAPAPQQQRAFSIASLAAVVQHPGVPSLLLVQACSGLAQSVFQSTFSLLIKKQYGLSSKANGMMLSYVGCCIVFGEFPAAQQLSPKQRHNAPVWCDLQEFKAGRPAAVVHHAECVSLWRFLLVAAVAAGAASINTKGQAHTQA